MDKRNKRTPYNLGQEVDHSTVSMDSTHQAETEAINAQKDVGTENDKMAKDR